MLKGDRLIFNVTGYIIIGIIASLCVLPILLVISGSFTAESVIIKHGYSLIPKEFSLEAYKVLMKAPMNMIRGYGVTIGITVVGTSIALFLTSMTAYVLQKKEFKYRNYFSFFFFFTTLFNGGLVPWYILMVQYLGMKNNYLALIVPYVFNVFFIIIMRSFINEIPEEISESAKLDGANHFQIFTLLIVPIAKPAMATIGMFIALNYWNEWYNTMLFISDTKMYTLQYFLYKNLNSMNFAAAAVAQSGIPLPQMPSNAFKLVMTVVATGPIVILYPFVQRYFVKGITIGAVKG